ncbi:N-acetyllactosaminide beta-1,3-N-acetylglucosaminyltransferase 3-like protein [Lates japonicus]|uniref:Hexosyltransferase n=1 Tax=Lates japonicus TaxID=270547 RepID=A0AAD3M420_LATJO|nr:N-acetyllactosaminide beta-1,3-N-acetylglucosaminyltransferase 3-like protein [Lates japonicus]
MLLDIPDKCGGADRSSEVFLLLVIKSSAANHDRRVALRKTWAKERSHNGVWIRRLFISGTMGTGFEKKRWNKFLELEQREYSDILQWDFNDTFLNLTLKQILFLEWMERNCPHVHFLLNGDDDVFANTDNIVQYLQSLKDNDGSKHLFIGHLIQNVGPIRLPWIKYYIPVQVQESDTYPPYCGGGGYLLSRYTALVIYRISQSITIHPIDDVYMGMCLAKAGLSPESHTGVQTAGIYIPSHKIDNYDPCYYRDILLVHRFLPPDLYLMWHRLNEPNLECFADAK